MSYYYNYYIGYQTSDKKIYPLGPYDNKGKLYNVFYKSRTFASDLHNDMYVADEDEYSDELKNEFSYEDCNGKTQYDNIKYLPISKLPSEKYIKSGFFLIEDITEYEKLKEEDFKEFMIEEGKAESKEIDELNSFRFSERAKRGDK